MRNFSSSIKNDSTFMVSAGWPSDKVYDRILRALLLSLECELHYMTPSEASVIEDFNQWWDAVCLDGRSYPPCFVYHNLNTGKSVACIAYIQEYDEIVYPSVC
jgi:hypothetical protein